MTREAFCRAVETALEDRQPGVTVSVVVDGEHFVVEMAHRGVATRTWRWPLAEPAYDAALGDPWSQDQAHYLALLADEENTDYLAGMRRRRSQGDR